MSKRVSIASAVRQAVLLEAGYKCANPTCRNVLALELHHIVWVKDGGGAVPDNLVALCGHCHDLHTSGYIPAAAIEAWKGLLISLNNPNRASADFLLILEREESRIEAVSEGEKTPARPRFTGDGLGVVAPLMTAGLVEFGRRYSGANAWGSSMPSFEIRLTDRGRLLVKAWLAGNPTEIQRVLNLPR